MTMRRAAPSLLLSFPREHAPRPPILGESVVDGSPQDWGSTGADVAFLCRRGAWARPHDTACGKLLRKCPPSRPPRVHGGRSKPRIFVLLLALVCLCAVSCTEPPATPTPAPVHLKLAGPTDMEPLGQALAEAYTALRPYATVTYLPGDWEFGPTAVARRSAAVGLWAGLPTDGTVDVGPGLTTTLIARDAVAVVVAPHNPVVSLSVRELQTLFAGRTPNWQDVGGRDQEVQVISWHDGARMRQLFDGLVMRGRQVTPSALVASSDEGVQALVSERPNVIGYMRWRALSPQVRALSVGGTSLTTLNVGAGHYPLSFPVVLVTEEIPGSDVQDLVRFVRSPEGQAVVARWLASLP